MAGQDTRDGETAGAPSLPSQPPSPPQTTLRLPIWCEALSRFFLCELQSRGHEEPRRQGSLAGVGTRRFTNHTNLTLETVLQESRHSRISHREVQRHQVTCPESHSLKITEAGLKPRTSDSENRAWSCSQEVPPQCFPFSHSLLSTDNFQSEGSSCWYGCQRWGSGICRPEAPRDKKRNRETHRDTEREAETERQIEGAVFILGRRHGLRSLWSS